MTKKTKVWLCVAIILFLVGSILFGGVMMLLKWDFGKLSTKTMETNTHALTQAYRHIAVETGAADVVLVPCEADAARVVCYEESSLRHSVSVQDDTLTVRLVNTKKWYEYIGISFTTPKITVYMPQGAYGDMVVASSAGDVQVPQDFTFESVRIVGGTGAVACRASVTGELYITRHTGAIDLQNVVAGAVVLTNSTGEISLTDVTCTGDVTATVGTGKVNLKNVACANLISGGNTGDVVMHNVIARQAMNVVRTTGEVLFDGCDASELSVKTDTGNVKGTLLTGKVFITQTDTGRVNVPETTVGGKCKITTDTGDIFLQVEK